MEQLKFLINFWKLSTHPSFSVYEISNNLVDVILFIQELAIRDLNIALGTSTEKQGERWNARCGYWGPISKILDPA